MKTRIEALLEKYWQAETTLGEEKELFDLLMQSDDFEKEKALFQGFHQFKSEEPAHLQIPERKVKPLYRPWISWAASVTILLGSFWSWRIYEQKQAEREAYEEVVQALAMIQTNLSKGQQQMQPLNDLKHLNTTNELFQLIQKGKE